MRPAFVGLTAVSSLFILGLALILTAAFTTHVTQFSGRPRIHLQFENEKHLPLTGSYAPVDGPPDEEGRYTYESSFEPRETNIFDTFGGGPHPRTASIAFNDKQNKHHEIVFSFDKNLKAWKAEIAFPDPTFAAVSIGSSHLDFVREVEGRREYSADVSASVLLGPPVISND